LGGWVVWGCILIGWGSNQMGQLYNLIAIGMQMDMGQATGLRFNWVMIQNGIDQTFPSIQFVEHNTHICMRV
jgi:hypothetical protein